MSCRPRIGILLASFGTETHRAIYELVPPWYSKTLDHALWLNGRIAGLCGLLAIFGSKGYYGIFCCIMFADLPPVKCVLLRL